MKGDPGNYTYEKYKIFFDKNGYIPQFFEAYNIRECEIAPSINATSGKWGACGCMTILVVENDSNKYEWASTENNGN